MWNILTLITVSIVHIVFFKFLKIPILKSIFSYFCIYFFVNFLAPLSFSLSLFRPLWISLFIKLSLLNFSSGSQRRRSLSLPVLTLIFPALLPCLVRDSLSTALQTKILWINWSLNAIDTIETWVSGNLTALTECSQPAGLVKRVWPAPDQWLRDQMAACWAGFTSPVAMSCMCFCVAEVFFLFSHCTPQGA